MLLVCLLVGCGGTGPSSEADPDGGAPAEGDASVEEVVAPDYARLFPDGKIVDVDLEITAESWDVLMADPRADVYVPANITYDGVRVENVAVRLKGNSSRNGVIQMGSERFSLKVDTDEYVDGQRLLGVDKLNFNNGFKDPTYLRETLGYELYRAMGVPSPRTAFVRLHRDGEPFGLYLVVEQVDKDFLRAHFDDAEGNLYKPEPPAGELRWLGSDFAAYEGMELKTNEEAPDHTGLLRFLDVLNNTPQGELEEAIEEELDVAGFVRWLAVTTVLVNLDSYAGPGHNYYLYEDPGAGRFVLLPWDVNESFGSFSCGYSADELLELSYLVPVCGDPARRPLIARLLQLPSVRAEYETRLAEALAIWTPEAVTARVDTLAALIRDDVTADPTRFMSVEAFEIGLYEDQIQGPSMRTTFGLTSFAERRSAILDAQLP
jgi:hypothetical protein